jgi:LAGLIDADG endonuclease
MRILKLNPVLTLLNSYLWLRLTVQAFNIKYFWNFGLLFELYLVMYIGSRVKKVILIVRDKLLWIINFIIIFIVSSENKKDERLSYIKNFLEEKVIPERYNDLNNIDFYEWFRGLVDGEGCFLITVDTRNSTRTYFRFIFKINLHRDDIFMLQKIKNVLDIGSVSSDNHFAVYSVGRRKDLLKIFDIFDKSPLNTSKNLDYVSFKEAYNLWHIREKNINNEDLVKKIINIKNSMNNKRTYFKQPNNHEIIITPYWLLGMIEGEGSFYVKGIDKTKSNLGLVFELGQKKSELRVLEAIKYFLLNLSEIDNLRTNRKNSNIVQHIIQNEARNKRSKPMTYIRITDSSYIKNVLVPFLNSLIWFSKKKQDYKDWKIILVFISEGKHFMKEGQELIYLINKRMNLRRLSTNPSTNVIINLDHKIKTLLEAPSNYEIHDNGKVFILSKGKYLRSRGNIDIEVYDNKSNMLKIFNSIKKCAQYFNTSPRTITRRLDKGEFFHFENEKIMIKRKKIFP